MSTATPTPPADGPHVRHYHLTHTTTYTYPGRVTSSHGRAILLPRTDSAQHVHIRGLRVEPGAEHSASHQDFAGNHSAYFHITSPHQRLQVTASSVLTTRRRRADPGAVPATPWEEVAQAVAAVGLTGSHPAVGGAGTAVAIAESRHSSPMVDVTEAVRDYALPSFAPGRPLAHVIRDLSSRIYADFDFVSGATTVDTRLEEVLDRRVGVCQHFAHLLIGCARSMGLAARYVSGYIETQPPPGQPKLRGVDASHAWAAVWLPGGGWLHIDPTNDQFIDSRYVYLGWGRDYRDVSPLRGIVFTEGSGSTLDVAVDLWPIEAGQVAATTERVRAEMGSAAIGVEETPGAPRLR